MKFQILAKRRNFKILKSLICVMHASRFCISRIYPPRRNQNFTAQAKQKSSPPAQNPRILSLKQSVILSIQAKSKILLAPRNFKISAKIKPLIYKCKIPPICKASRLIYHATKIKFLNSARSAYLANK
ncbi:hypothetical protein [uncultured Campylobacter sp.]|uniref:hypothetical protein n=1 Tax=uncultured Campylobacter sp. TaxID=218934 RepID=UPI002608969C|nr:hypothetical protein [uncultured Campylobacter sp.]